METRSLAFIIGFIAISLFFIICIVQSTNRKKNGIKRNREVSELEKKVSPIKILTPYERKMYHMLRDITPDEYQIQYQVSFNALIKCSDIKLRNKFNRRSLDFLIVDKNFIPVVCVELDDRTHNMKNVMEQDEFRDNLLSAVKIPTERFNGLPKNKAELRKRMACYFKEHQSSLIYEDLIKTP